MPSYERYAIYYVPNEDDPLLITADKWLGRSTLLGQKIAQPNLPDISSKTVSSITASARRYGFHATLKAPFRLASKVSRRRFLKEVENLALQLPAVPCVNLKLDQLGEFLALRPIGDDSALRALGNVCVTQLDHFRKPLCSSERERRHRTALSPQQDRFLDRWGYPYVLDQFRFHMTLSNALPANMIDQVFDALSGYFKDVLLQPTCVDTVCVVADPGDGKSFEVIERFSLAPPHRSITPSRAKSIDLVSQGQMASQ